MSRAAVEEMLNIGKTRFCAWLKAYQRSPTTFSLTDERDTPARLSASVEAAIKKGLLREKELVDEPQLPMADYNYSALRDRLKKTGVTVSATTITNRAKQLACYQPHRKGKAHDRQVVTAAIGALVQHDASLHLWSAFAEEQWTLITSLDDDSRTLLFADFCLQETAWAHSQAAPTLLPTYGWPLQYDVDTLRVFRFVQGRDSHWRKHVLETDDGDPPWRQVLRGLGVAVRYALSAQAKGKIERP